LSQVIIACTLVQAVVKASSQSNISGQILMLDFKTSECILMILSYCVTDVTTHADSQRHVTCHMFWFLRHPFKFVNWFFSACVKTAHVDLC